MMIAVAVRWPGSPILQHNYRCIEMSNPEPFVIAEPEETKTAHMLSRCCTICAMKGLHAPNRSLRSPAASFSATTPNRRATLQLKSNKAEG